VAEWAVEQLAEEVVVDRQAVAVEVVELALADPLVVAAAEVVELVPVDSLAVAAAESLAVADLLVVEEPAAVATQSPA